MSGETCAECIHWDHEDAYHAAAAIRAGWGICKRSEVGFTEDFTTVPEGEDWYAGVFLPPPDVKMFAQDGSDYWAALVTAPDFGCSEFRRAPAQARGSSGEEE